MVSVEPGKTYRLRFIGATALTFALLAFEGHDSLTVIEADGSYTQPYNTSILQIGGGQRYSVLLTTKAAPEKSSYFMQVESRDRPSVARSFAVLQYGLKPATKPMNPLTAPLTLPNITRGFLDDLAPLHPSRDFPTSAEVTRRITLTVHQKVSGQTVWLQNAYNWTDSFPQTPYLVALYENTTNTTTNPGLPYPSLERALANNGIDPVTRTFPARLGEVLEIVIQNTGADKGGLDIHPFHAHGAHFWDLGSGNGTFNGTANDASWAARGHQPPLRDTNGVGFWG
ncbi:putative L-ascorbate oxidase [Glarea lozoyensis 74030]|uniref:Putative L-ascorbate oxidase n=1 Tax=Glarea lozoyensis (strain ATCC 74030 / MF5533) TaxID=1104152 RepID=H0EXM5_GLAL7|nr:putative L-ascorbate oxidase [Glarea lozoyensis 74030]